MWYRTLSVSWILFGLSHHAVGQEADTAFHYQIPLPAYGVGAGPVVCIDAAHSNRHTATGTYAPFANLLRADGYQVRGLDTAWSRTALTQCGIVVTVNALAPENLRDRSLPHPPAFSKTELDAVVGWVNDGGALLLIADHSPWAGAVAGLAMVFGFAMLDAFAGPGDQGAVIALFGAPNVPDGTWRQYATDRSLPYTPIQGAVANVGSLGAHKILRGRGAAERIAWMVTFTGSVFLPSSRVEPLLVFGPRAIAILDRPDASPFPVGGWLQAGAARFGEGRVVMIGEAATCTAQVGGPRRIPTGMNVPVAPYNAQFCLNAVHWLTRLLDDVPG